MNEYSNIFVPGIVEQYMEDNPTAKVADAVYDCLEQAILSSRIAPGEKINVTNIAEAMGISVTPVRTAVRQMISDGFISEGENGKRLYVFEVSEQMLTELFNLRWALEGSSTYLCAQQFANIDMDRLWALADEFRSLWLRVCDGDRSLENRRRRIELDCAFHRLLLRYTGVSQLTDAYESASKIITYSLLRSLEAWESELPKNIHILANQHHVICNAIESGIPDAARHAAEQHVNFAKIHCLINRRVL